jgi:hypothetical protein
MGNGDFMVRKRIVHFVLACAATALTVKAANLSAEEMSAQEIVDRAVARAEAQYASQIETQFESAVSAEIQAFDASGQVINTNKARYLQIPLHGALFEELIEKDGRALNEKERSAEEKNKNRFIREVENRKKRGLHPQPEKRPGVQFNKRLMFRYRFRIKGTEAVGGHRCWAITFEPGEGQLPVQEMMDHALNQSTGTLWVAQDDYGLARLDFLMSKPFKYWAGLLAVIRNTEGRLDFQRVERRVWLPSHFNLKLDLKVMMVKNIRRHITKTWTDYKRVKNTVALRHSVYRMSKGFDSAHDIYGRRDTYSWMYRLMAGKSVFTARFFPTFHEVRANAASLAFVSGESTSVALMP